MLRFRADDGRVSEFKVSSLVADDLVLVDILHRLLNKSPLVVGNFCLGIWHILLHKLSCVSIVAVKVRMHFCWIFYIFLPHVLPASLLPLGWHIHHCLGLVVVQEGVHLRLVDICACMHGCVLLDGSNILRLAEIFVSKVLHHPSYLREVDGFCF